jgi:hypothetical protein
VADDGGEEGVEGVVGAQLQELQGGAHAVHCGGWGGGWGRGVRVGGVGMVRVRARVCVGGDAQAGASGTKPAECLAAQQQQLGLQRLLMQQRQPRLLGCRGGGVRVPVALTGVPVSSQRCCANQGWSRSARKPPAFSWGSSATMRHQ